jgi:hypothetical protein
VEEEEPVSNRRRSNLTLAEARAELRAIGVTLKKSDGEYRVNFEGGPEKTAYYTDDINDAVKTGKAMVAKLAEFVYRSSLIDKI